MFVQDKVRGPIDRFNERWNCVIIGRAINAEVLDPQQEDLQLAGAA